MARRLRRFGAAWPGRLRGGRFAALVIMVAAVHGCVTHELATRMDAFASAARMPARIEVAYVRTLEPQTPAIVAPPPQAAPRRRIAAARPAQAASAVEPAKPVEKVAQVEPVDAVDTSNTVKSAERIASAQEAEPVQAAEPIEPNEPNEPNEPIEPAAPVDPLVASDFREPPALDAVTKPVDAAPVVEAAASASSTQVGGAVASAASPFNASSAPRTGSAEPFDWPASTRVAFVLTGNYRGEVNGDAQVEWIRVGTHYQVHLDLRVGPEFAPLITRRMTSEGELTAGGLAPSRYDEETQVVFRDARRYSVRFEPDAVMLGNGERHERWPGLQDTASQFIQMTWLFTIHPELLTVGRTVEMPLALPKKVDRWVYDVLDEVVVHTSFGPLPAFHLKPRRANPKAGELSAEIWFAPQLRYLPVRIRIEQDPQTYLDLVIARKPELAAR